MTGSTRERIAEFEYTILGLVHWNRTIASDLRTPARVQESIDQDLRTIAACQARIARALKNLEHGRDQIEANEARIVELRNQIVLEKNQAAIEKLLRLQAQLNEFGVAACDAEDDEDSEDSEELDTDE